jgi:hypothetical protein
MRRTDAPTGLEGGSSSGSDPAPQFLSFDFHLSFFPRLLVRRLRRKGKDGGVTFTSTLEATVLLAVCVVLALIGLPSALAGGSIPGWVPSVLGVGGTTVLFVWSVASAWGSPPEYDRFGAGVFFFFVALGVFFGVPVGLSYHSFHLGTLASLGGLVCGYLLGIFSGRQVQRLGWISVIVDMLAGLAAIGLAGTALVMFFALAAG